jgi:hypothetical protein
MVNRREDNIGEILGRGRGCRERDNRVKDDRGQNNVAWDNEEGFETDRKFWE